MSVFVKIDNEVRSIYRDREVPFKSALNALNGRNHLGNNRLQRIGKRPESALNRLTHCPATIKNTLEIFSCPQMHHTRHTHHTHQMSIDNLLSFKVAQNVLWGDRCPWIAWPRYSSTVQGRLLN